MKRNILWMMDLIEHIRCIQKYDVQICKWIRGIGHITVTSRKFSSSTTGRKSTTCNIKRKANFVKLRPVVLFVVVRDETVKVVEIVVFGSNKGHVSLERSDWRTVFSPLSRPI